MRLYDYISDADKKAITEWIEINKQCTITNLKNVLKYWEKNNKTLFKLLGNQLRYKISVDIQKKPIEHIHQLKEIYQQPQITTASFNKIIKLWEPARNQFIEDFFNYIFTFDWKYEYDRGRYSSSQIKLETPEGRTGIFILTSLFSYAQVRQGFTIKDIQITYLDKKPLFIKSNTKIMRAIRKVLLYLDYPRMDLFDQWRNEVSDIGALQRIKGNLVLSIHPLDFLTLSDNNCGWYSCVSMQVDSNQAGEMSNTLTEMMNSNCVIVAYLESNHNKFVFNFNEIPNKSWRQLFYCHKDIICGGKPYPYTNDSLTKEVLSILAELALTNLSWQYTYGPQLYKDIHSYNSKNIRNYQLKEDKKQIIFYTYGYYNDMVVDHETNYWCIRNRVPRGKKICVSGPATCLTCGEKIIPNLKNILDKDSYTIASEYSGSFCNKCYDCKCGHCGRINPNMSTYHFYPNGGIYPLTLCEECSHEPEFRQEEKFLRNKGR